MTDQSYFETEVLRGFGGDPGRVRVLSTKRRPTDESRRQAEIDASRWKAVQTRALIAELERTVVSLEVDIAAELERTRVRDPLNIAYPISVTTLAARRDNVKATLAALSERLTEAG
jgi:hypothetical protein